MYISEKILKSLTFVFIVCLTLAFLSSFKSTTALKPTDNMEIATPDPSLTLDARTDKDSYLLRQRVIIEGNITEDSSPPTDLLVIIQAEDPINTPIAYRTLTVGNPTQTWLLNITDLFLKDMSGNSINTAKIGTQFQVGITLYNWQMTKRDAFATITVFDANMAPLQVGFWSGTIDPLGTISPIFTIYLEKWVCSGQALICGNVYSKEPKIGGLAYSKEKTTYFCISKTQQGMFEYPDLPPPSPQTTPGFFTTNMSLSPDPRAGQYKLYLTSQVSSILISSTTTTFNVQQSSGYPPQASFIFWPATPYLNQTVNFDASFSTPEGFNDTITSYQWDFGDGTKITRTTPTITHAYQNTGTFTVILNVTDNEGLWSTTSKPITILPEFGPTANFTWTPTLSIVNVTILFNASNTQLGWCAETQRFSPIQDYVWNFSDGTGIFSVTTPETSHKFTQPGNYSVSLTVIDADGRQDTVSYLVQVLNQTAHPWDVDGSGRVDMIDMWIVQKHFGTIPSSPDWDPRADVDGSERVDMLDMWIVQKHFGEMYP